MTKRRSSWLAGIALLSGLGLVMTGSAHGQDGTDAGSAGACVTNGCSTDGCSSVGCTTDACGVSDSGVADDWCSNGCEDPSGGGSASSCCSSLSGMCGDCCLGDPWELCDGKNSWDVGGWVQLGYHNGVTPLSVAPHEGFSFNDHPHRLNLHQGWMYVEKAADATNGADWGFRADLMYGVDAPQTQAFGNPSGKWDFQNGWDRGVTGYGWALPQLYGEYVSGDWSIVGGHFYTLVGYETVTSPDNFFYSHALTKLSSEPFTHTGVVATYSASDNVDVYAGWTLGWDTGLAQLAGGNSFLGGLSTSLGDNVTFTYIATAGDLGWRGNSGYSHSLVFDVTVTDNLNYVFQSDFVHADDFVQVAGFVNDDIGINQYLIYTINDCFAVGARLEWWKTDAGGNGSQSVNEVTFGVNYRPHANVVLRPEIRHDWSPGNNFDETTFGMDAVFTF